MYLWSCQNSPYPAGPRTYEYSVVFAGDLHLEAPVWGLRGPVTRIVIAHAGIVDKEWSGPGSCDWRRAGTIFGQRPSHACPSL